MISLNSVVFGSGPVGFGVSVNFWTLTRPNKHFPIPNMYYCYKHHSSKNPIIRIFLSEEPLQYTHTQKENIYIYLTLLEIIVIKYLHHFHFYSDIIMLSHYIFNFDNILKYHDIINEKTALGKYCDFIMIFFKILRIFVTLVCLLMQLLVSYFAE